MLNYHLNITICKDLACQTLWHNVRHENDNEINWHFYSFKTFKLSFPCIVPKIDNIFWWLIINSNGYTKFENFQKCQTNGAEYRGQTHIYIYTRAVSRMPAFVTNCPVFNTLFDSKCRSLFTGPCDLCLCGYFDLWPKFTKWSWYYIGVSAQYQHHKWSEWA